MLNSDGSLSRLPLDFDDYPTPYEAAEQSHMWHTMPTQTLLTQAYKLTQQIPNSEATLCIYALTHRLQGSEEWIESQARRLENLRVSDWNEALRSYGRRLAELARQEPFNTIDFGGGIRLNASDVAAHFFNALLEVLFEAGLISPAARTTLADWLLDEAL